MGPMGGQRGFGGGGGSGGGRWRDGVGRAFSGNPLSWALPLYTAWGIRVRVHFVFILMVAFELLGTIGPNRPAIEYVGPMMLGLFLLVLLHEYGHCFACRRVGGEADDILMWPLGGLASCRPPHEWRADLWTTIGGPAVNAVLIVPLGALVLLLGGGWNSVIFNPFDLNPVLGGLGGSWALIIAWSLYFSNAMLLAFNVLLPMYPMDGGRILHALLWSRLGHTRATRIVVKIGFGIAILLFLFAIVFSQSRLLGLAIFGGFTCYMEWQRLKLMGDGDESWRGGSGDTQDDVRRALAQSEKQRKRREAEQRQAADEQAQVDRLLDKIKDQGMQSLTAKERKFLEEATKRARGG